MKTKLMAMLLAASAMLGAYAANVRVYVNVVPEAGWDPDRYFYAWSGTVQNFGAWPGIKVENTEVLNGETWHYMDIDATDDEFYLIFNDGESHCQTINVLIAPVKEGKRFFVRVSSEGEANAFSGRTSNYATIEYEKVQLWEGGPYWATMNIGAELPEDYGYYFWWGDTVGYKWENGAWVATDGSSSSFSFSTGNTPTYNKDDTTLQSEGWTAASGILAPEHDAAYVQWGDDWRMPTDLELTDLKENCDWAWTTTNGVNGYIVRGRGTYASASIFLPAAGYGYGDEFLNAGSGGKCWSSVPCSDDDYYYSTSFSFGSTYRTTNNEYRNNGFSVRPVQDAPDAPVDPVPTTVTIGSGDVKNGFLPTYILYNYSLTQQIYTSKEIGMAGDIYSIAFKNSGEQEKTRTLDIYLVHTKKNSFSSSNWIPVTAGDRVFSGVVAFTAGDWTTIAFDKPFDYNGTDNLAVILDDNTGSWESSISSYVFDANSMSMYVYSDGTNFDPTNPESYNGTILNVKNQIQLGFAGGDAAAAVAEFAESDISVSEAETMSIVVSGGSETRPTSVKVYLSYLNAAAADIDLKNATVNGVTPKGGLKFPLTLAWDTGDTEPKTIAIPVKPDKLVEDSEALFFQLADAVGMEIGEESLCCVTVSDLNTKTLKAAVSPYKPKKGEAVETNDVSVVGTEGGFVAGTGAYTAGTKLTLTAEARPGWTFTGWSDCCSEGIISDKAKYQVVVDGDAVYYASFAPQPYICGVAIPGDGGKVSGSGYCPAGKKVTLKAAANKGFRFVEWCDYEGNLVATTPSLVIDRTTKPAASSKTSTTLTGIDETSSFFAVFEGDPRVTATPVAFTESGTPVASEGGKVTGAGRYAPGKKVTLKATAGKGFVFGGWFATDGSEPISQAASFSFEMGEEDVDLYARFVTAEEDKGSITLALNGEEMAASSSSPSCETNVMCGVSVKWSLAAEALSQPTVKVAGLPAGLKFTAKDIMKKGSKTEVEVPANTIYGAPTAASKTDKGGNPTPSNVKVTVTTAGKSSETYTMALTVDPLPEWAVGSFYGGSEKGAGSFTVAANGKISGKINVDATAVSFSAASFDDYDPDSEYLDAKSGAFLATVTYKVEKETVTVPLHIVEHSMDGFKTGVAVLSESVVFIRADWKEAKWKAAAAPFSKAEPYEYDTKDSASNPGKVTLKFASSGAVTASGAFVTGKDAKGKDIVYKASATTTLIPISDIDGDGKFAACVYVNFPPKAGKFAGYSDRVGLKWTGAKFEQGEMD